MEVPPSDDGVPEGTTWFELTAGGSKALRQRLPILVVIPVHGAGRDQNKTRESANGREIERTIKCVSLADGINFPHATQAAQITRKSRPLGTRKWSTETVYIVTSLTPAQGKPELIGFLIRGHWGIENGLRSRRDVTWRE